MSENLEKVNENAEIKEEQNVARNRSEKVVVEYRKPSFIMSLLLILIGVCLATIVLILVYIFKIKPQDDAIKTPTEQTEVVEEPVVEETKVSDVDLSINGAFAKELDKKVPYDMVFVKNYIDGKTDQANLSDEAKLLYVFMLLKTEGKYTQASVEGFAEQLDKNYDAYGLITKADKYTVEDVQERYNKIFGSDKVITKTDVDFYVYHVDYYAPDDCFYGHEFQGGGGMPWISDTRVDSLEQSEDGKEVYLYEYYIRAGILDDKSVFTYGYEYGSALGVEPNATYYEQVEPININNWHVKDEIFEKYKNNGLVKFKSTFKLEDNGNYYWVSTEPVK